MKTSQGKLAALAFALLMAVVLFAPMRSGQRDELLLEPEVLRMSVGDSYALRCALSAENPNQRLSFTSSDPGVARIDRDGTVHGISSGEAVIRARASGGASAQTRVTVAGVAMTELSLNVSEVRIDKGEFTGLRASYNADATNPRLQWVSSNEDVVRVDNSGRLEGVGGGEAYVSAVSSNGLSATARVYVRVEGTAAHISPDRITLGVGARVPLKLTLLPLDCTDSVRRWISSDPSVLSVSGDGVLDARAVGSAYVTAVTDGGLTAGMEVAVEAAPEDIQLDPSRATLERGETMQMQLMFLEEDGSAEENPSHLVSWSSSDPSVASVDANGLVTARKGGKCRIRASADGMSASCSLSVQVSIQEIRLDRSEVYLLPEDAGEPIQLHCVYAPVDPDDPTIIFASDNEQVATVTKDGLVEMTGGYGTAVITATAASGVRAEFVVNVVTQLPEEEAAPATEPPENAAPYEEIYRQMHPETVVEVTPTPLPVPAATRAPVVTQEPAAAPPDAGATIDPETEAIWN